MRSDGGPELAVIGFPHFAHAALAELLDVLVVADGGAYVHRRNCTF